MTIFKNKLDNKFYVIQKHICPKCSHGYTAYEYPLLRSIESVGICVSSFELNALYEKIGER